FFSRLLPRYFLLSLRVIRSVALVRLPRFQHFKNTPLLFSDSLISNITCTPTNKAAQAVTKKIAPATVSRSPFVSNKNKRFPPTFPIMQNAMHNTFQPINPHRKSHQIRTHHHQQIPHNSHPPQHSIRRASVLPFPCRKYHPSYYLRQHEQHNQPSPD